MFWEISDILWKCFGFHWLAKLAEIIKTCGKISVFEGPWQRMDVLWNHKLAEVIKKNKKTQKTLEKHCFPPMLFCPGDIFIFISIYLPAITCSHFKLRPSPTYWPTVCLPIYLCVYIHICMYWFLDLYIYLQLPAVILSSDPPQPIDLLSAYLFIYVYIYMYVCICFCIYIFTCNQLQSF